MKQSIHINYDEAPNGDYMGEACRVAKELEEAGHKNVTVSDLGNGAEVEYEETESSRVIQHGWRNFGRGEICNPEWYGDHYSSDPKYKVKVKIETGELILELPPKAYIGLHEKEDGTHYVRFMTEKDMLDFCEQYTGERPIKMSDEAVTDEWETGEPFISYSRYGW